MFTFLILSYNAATNINNPKYIPDNKETYSQLIIFSDFKHEESYNNISYSKLENELKKMKLNNLHKISLFRFHSDKNSNGYNSTLSSLRKGIQEIDMHYFSDTSFKSIDSYNGYCASLLSVPLNYTKQALHFVSYDYLPNRLFTAKSTNLPNRDSNNRFCTVQLIDPDYNFSFPDPVLKIGEHQIPINKPVSIPCEILNNGELTLKTHYMPSKNMKLSISLDNEIFTYSTPIKVIPIIPNIYTMILVFCYLGVLSIIAFNQITYFCLANKSIKYEYNAFAYEINNKNTNNLSDLTKIEERTYNFIKCLSLIIFILTCLFILYLCYRIILSNFTVLLVFILTFTTYIWRYNSSISKHFSYQKKLSSIKFCQDFTTDNDESKTS